MDKNTKKRRLLLSSLAILVVYFLFCVAPSFSTQEKMSQTVFASQLEGEITSFASDTLIGITVDYINEQVILSPGVNGSTKYYFSSDKKNWELLPSNVMDISMLLKAKSVTVYFKGNRDAGVYAYQLQGEETTLKPEYTVINGQGHISVSGGAGTIEYRKGTKGPWITYTAPILSAPYEVKGCTFYFRVAATSATRAQKMVTLKVSKRASAPNVKLDGNKLALTGIKDTMEYRIGDNSDWKSFAESDLKAKYISFQALFANQAMQNTAIPAGVIEVRTKSTNGKVASSAKLLTTEPQPGMPSTPSITGTTLTISDASNDKKYEYAILNKITTSLDLYTQKWSAVAKNTPIVLKNISVGDRVLVRLKSTTDKTTQVVTPASLFKEFIITSISP